jgi:hypothetical protein
MFIVFSLTEWEEQGKICLFHFSVRTRQESTCLTCRPHFIFLLLYWGYIVAFTKVLTMYHSWIHSFHHSPLSPLPSFLTQNKINRSYFSIYIHVYTVFAPYSPSHTPSPHPLPSHWYQSLRQDLLCPPVLQFYKRKKMAFMFVEDRYTGSFLVTFPCIYVLQPEFVHL